jgi:predicted TIM-barrel fold metal-dependent hydrolase
MDKAGIDMQVLSSPLRDAEGLNASDVAKHINDGLSKVVERYPKSFAAFAAIAPQYPDEAANELERAVKTLGAKGAMISSGQCGEYLDEHKYWEIFEVAEKLEVPIYLHPGPLLPDMVKPYTT